MVAFRALPIVFGALLADKAFDIDWIRVELNNRGAMAVIPPKADRATNIPCDFAMYRWRHLVKTSSAISKNFAASLPDMTRLIAASKPQSTSSGRSWHSNECPQALEQIVCHLGGEYLRDRSIRSYDDLIAALPAVIGEALFSRRLTVPIAGDSRRRRWALHPLSAQNRQSCAELTELNALRVLAVKVAFAPPAANPDRSAPGGPLLAIPGRRVPSWPLPRTSPHEPLAPAAYRGAGNVVAKKVNGSPPQSRKLTHHIKTVNMVT